MFNQAYANGPFRIDQTFSLPPSGVHENTGGGLGEMSIIAPVLIEAEEIRPEEISTKRVDANAE